MREPYDWEKEEHDPWKGRHRSQGDASFVTHYEFNEVVSGVEERIYALHLRTEEIEDRLVDTRVKRVAVDIVASGILRVTAIVVGVIMALILTNLIDVPNPFK